MRGIERVVAAILLAGAVVGAAAFTHLLGRNPDITAQLGLPRPGQPGIVQAAPLPAGPLEVLPDPAVALSRPGVSLAAAPGPAKLLRLRPALPTVPRRVLPAPTTTPSPPAPTPAPAAPAPAAPAPQPAAPAPTPPAPTQPTSTPPTAAPVAPKPVTATTVPPTPVSPPPVSHPDLPVPPIAAPPAIVVSKPLLGPPSAPVPTPAPTPGPVLPVDTSPDPSAPSGSDDGGNG
jgi:hypothetical protein